MTHLFELQPPNVNTPKSRVMEAMDISSYSTDWTWDKIVKRIREVVCEHEDRGREISYAASTLTSEEMDFTWNESKVIDGLEYLFRDIEWHIDGSCKLDDPLELLNKIKQKLIDNFDDQFSEAMWCIERSRDIGIGLQGVAPAWDGLS